jgi:WD40 repeat protein
MTTTVADTRNPYVGPRAFLSGETLYGREREIDDLTGLLIAERIVLLHSPSGAGKTSLIQAALIPRLAREGLRALPIIRVNAETGIDYSEAASSSGNSPNKPFNRYIHSVLLSLEEEVPHDQQTPPDELARMSLETYLAHRLEAIEADDIVLIFDQFEEIITIEPTNLEAKTAFFTQLGAVLRQPRTRDRTTRRSRIWSLFAMREDYLASLEPYLRLVPTRFKNTFRLDLLQTTAARAAIQHPARTMGVTFSDAAVNQLIDDLRMVQVQQPDGSVQAMPGPYIEPVQLQVVCRRVWDHLPPNQQHIEPANLAEVGDVSHALGSYYAQAVASVAANTHIPERNIREWFDKHLITEQNIRGQVLQGSSASNGLPNEAISLLLDAHLIRSDKRRGATWFELAHDRLIEPVRQDNAAWFAAHLSLLERQAALWESQNRPAGLLLHGEALSNAEQWASQHTRDMLPREHDLLAASQAARAAAQREARMNLIIRWAAVGLSVLLVVALAATAAAIYQSQRVQEQLKISQAQSLAFAAQSVQEAPETALLLAYEAAARHTSSLTDQTLRNALYQSNWQPTTMPGHTDEIINASYSPDGERILTVSNDDTARLWRSDGNLIAVLEGHGDDVWHGAFSPDGRYLATGATNGSVILWDIEGTLLRQLEGHSAWVNTVAFSPDSRTLVTSSDDSTARLWDIEGNLLHTLEGHEDIVTNAVFSPDGRYILTTSYDTTARLWDTEGNQVRIFMGHTGKLRTSGGFSPDGQLLVTASDDATARVWGLDGISRAVLTGHDALLYAAVFSPDGHYIATASADGTARLWKTDGTPHAVFAGHNNEVRGVAFRSDGQQLLTASLDGTARLWQLNGEQVHIFQGHHGLIRSALFHPRDNQQVLTAAEIDATPRVWREVGLPLASYQGHTDEVFTASYSRDGSRVLTASQDGTARLWDSSDGSLIATFEGHTDGILSAVFSPDEQRLVTASYDTTVRVWDINSQNLLMTLEGHNEGVMYATFSPDGHTIATASLDGTARLWDASSGEQLALLRGHGDERGAQLENVVEVRNDVYRINFSPDGQKLITAGQDGTARLWDASSGNLLHVIRVSNNFVNDATFSPDGQSILTATGDQVVALWKLDGTLVSRFDSAHQDAIIRATFSPDGHSIVTASFDQTARVLTLDGNIVTTIQTDALLWDAQFHPNGRHIVLASSDGTSNQYIVPLANILEIAACRVGRGLTEEERERFLIAEPRLVIEERHCPPPSAAQE